jgi:FAD binding domain-containing protein
MPPRQPSFNPIKEWRNFHQSYEQVIAGEYDLFMPQQSAPLSFGDLRETTRQVQALIAAARGKGLKIRAIGSAWSLSKAPATSGWALNTNRLRGRMKIVSADIDPAYPGTADQKAGLYFFQCGNTVADVNKVIESKAERRSLFTSGAANGQTIVGATACGTHGSALDHGALHDHVVALHLIPTGGSHFWIERKSRPVMNPAWVAKLGATLKRDDDLFNAALVSFGSFGIVEGVVIETVPRYLLETEPGTATLDENLWKAIGALDFSAHPFFKEGRPYFFQAVINPATEEVLLHANYQRADDGREPKYGLTQDPKAIGPGFDALSTVGLILDAFKGLIPAFSKLATRQLFDTTKKTGTSGQIYGYKAPLLHVASGSVAVALADARRTLEALIELYNEIGPVPLVLGCRYVSKSPALLAFNKFGTGLMVSIDGVDSKKSRAYFAAAADRLEAKGIDFTQHWGKVNGYTKARVLKAYGGNVAKWLNARKQVLPGAADRAVFDNAYIEERGLAG